MNDAAAGRLELDHLLATYEGPLSLECARSWFTRAGRLSAADQEATVGMLFPLKLREEIGMMGWTFSVRDLLLLYGQQLAGSNPGLARERISNASNFEHADSGPRLDDRLEVEADAALGELLTVLSDVELSGTFNHAKSYVSLWARLAQGEFTNGYWPRDLLVGQISMPIGLAMHLTANTIKDGRVAAALRRGADVYYPPNDSIELPGSGGPSWIGEIDFIDLRSAQLKVVHGGETLLSGSVDLSGIEQRWHYSHEPNLPLRAYVWDPEDDDDEALALLIGRDRAYKAYWER